MSETRPKPEGPNTINLNIRLNEEQRRVRESLSKHSHVFIEGEPGTGKTSCASYIAIEYFRRKLVNNIVLCRPVLDTNIGFLSGNLGEKMDPWVEAMLNSFSKLQGEKETAKMQEKVSKRKDPVLQVRFIDHMGGLSLEKTFVIIDEYQNLNADQVRLLMTRIDGDTSKMLFCGDPKQVSPRAKRHSAIRRVHNFLRHCPDVGYVKLEKQYRNDKMSRILGVWDNL